MREDEPNLYIVMFLNRNLPFVVSGMHWARLGDVEALYRIKTTTTRHQCFPHLQRGPRRHGESQMIPSLPIPHP